MIRPMFTEKIETAIEIKASPERVWDVLTDLARYSEWNPMIREASGDIRQGTRLRVFFNPAGTRGKTFRPKLITVTANRELRWQGQPGVPALLESEHIFIIEHQSGGVRLVHDMIFYGLLIPLARKMFGKAVRGPFNDMNRALKERAEGIGNR